MPVVVCQSCHSRLKVDVSAAGRALACPKCGESVPIPPGIRDTSPTKIASSDPASIETVPATKILQEPDISVERVREGPQKAILLAVILGGFFVFCLMLTAIVILMQEPEKKTAETQKQPEEKVELPPAPPIPTPPTKTEPGVSRPRALSTAEIERKEDEAAVVALAKEIEKEKESLAELERKARETLRERQKALGGAEAEEKALRMAVAKALVEKEKAIEREKLSADEKRYIAGDWAKINLSGAKPSLDVTQRMTEGEAGVLDFKSRALGTSKTTVSQIVNGNEMVVWGGRLIVRGVSTEKLKAGESIDFSDDVFFSDGPGSYTDRFGKKLSAPIVTWIDPKKILAIQDSQDLKRWKAALAEHEAAKKRVIAAITATGKAQTVLEETTDLILRTARKNPVAIVAARRLDQREAAAAEAAKRTEEERAEAKRKADEEYDIRGLVLLRKTVEALSGQITFSVTGTVVNRRKVSLRYAYIVFIIYDESGAQIGTARATISNLEAGARWNFKAVGFARDGAKYKLSELSGF